MPATQRRRLQRGSLSADALLDAAARVLDSAGVEGLTMRALASEIGADPTAVYRYFRTKDDLLAALTDRLLAGIALPPADAVPAAQLEHLGHELRAALLRYPGGVGLVTESPFSRSSVRLVEHALAGLVDGGMAPDAAVDALQAVVAYVVGHAAQVTADDRGFWSEVLQAAHPPGEFPHLYATSAAWLRSGDEQFVRGLRVVLGGLRVVLGGLPSRH